MAISGPDLVDGRSTLRNSRNRQQPLAFRQAIGFWYDVPIAPPCSCEFVLAGDWQLTTDN